MLSVYRLFIVAIGLVLIAAHPNPVAQPKQAPPQERSANARESIATHYDHELKVEERSNYEKPCAKGDDQRDSDLCAQWKAADSANLAAWLSGLSFAAVLVALYLAFRSNSIARGTAHSQLRAYVTLGTVEMRRRSTKAGEKKWFIDVDLENKAQSPAFIRHFYIVVGWRRNGIAPDIIDQVFSKSRDIQVVIASEKPFGLFVEIEADFSPAALHDDDELVIMGKVEYIDIFGEKRTTTYRQYADRNCWEKGAGVVAIFTSMTGNTCT